MQHIIETHNRMKEFDWQLRHIDKLTDKLRRFSLALSDALPFYAGQFGELTPPWAELHRSYSIASGPARAARDRLRHRPDSRDT